jgi:hypothetical protein
MFTQLQRSFIQEFIMDQEPKSYASHCEAIVDAKKPPFASKRWLCLGESDFGTALKLAIALLM